ATGVSWVQPRTPAAFCRGGRRYQAPPKTLRRTVSADTAATLTAIMEEVVTRGTAKRAQIAGYPIAGKTGTAQKLIDGHYSHRDHNASFIGFIPSRAPELAIVVVIDSAKGPNGDHGGMVAAPLFRDNAEGAPRYLRVPPTFNPPTPALGPRPQNTPAGPRRRRAVGRPAVSLIADGSPGTVPDLTGLSARDALRKLVKIGMSARVSGDGFVVSQEPPPGALIEADAVCRLVLERWPRHRAAASRQ